jgi:hypothetical protein
LIHQQQNIKPIGCLKKSSMGIDIPPSPALLYHQLKWRAAFSKERMPMTKTGLHDAIGDFPDRILNMENLGEIRRFKREGKLTAKAVLALVLGGIKTSTQTFLLWMSLIGIIPVSAKSAFPIARSKLKPELLHALFPGTAALLRQCAGLALFRGMRLIAIDGSTAALFNSAANMAHFGHSGDAGACSALPAAAYDALNGLIMATQLNSANTPERASALALIDTALGLPSAFPFKRRFIFGKVCLGADLHGDLIDRGVNFVVRSRRVKEFEGIRKEGCASFRSSVGSAFLLRVILASLPGGEIGHLAASLPAAPLPRRMAKAFRLLRWPMGKASTSPKTSWIWKTSPAGTR